MDQKFPFTSYDFWAYLSAGFLLLFAIDQAMSTKLLMRDSWTVVQGVVAVSVAYVVGHLVASASSFLLEKMLVGRLLGYPRNVLPYKLIYPSPWSIISRLPKPRSQSANTIRPAAIALTGCPSEVLRNNPFQSTVLPGRGVP